MKLPRVRVPLAWLVVIMPLAGMMLAPTASAQTVTPAAGKPGFETFGALPWEPPHGGEPYLVEKVVDGDTFRVIAPEDAGDPDPWWEPVRLIGVDSPEKDGPYTGEECYGAEASAFLKQLLPKGTTVYLQVDDDPGIPNDKEFNNEGMEPGPYDRWLVHAYLKAGGTQDYYLVSEILALGGYVDVRDYDDNTYFVNVLYDAEGIARAHDLGLWGACSAG